MSAKQSDKPENKQSKTEIEDDDEELCLICCDILKDRINSTCGHNQVCGICVLRMRFLLKDKRCPFCKTEVNVLIHSSSGPSGSYFIDEKSELSFENESDMHRYQALMSISCQLCPAQFPCYDLLRGHLQDKHQKHLCTVCLNHQQLFSSEIRIFRSKAELNTHTQKGSRGIEPHPFCQFCKQAWYDKDYLFLHLEQDHFKCHFCHASGSQTYYADYAGLFKHFDREHIVCREQRCLDNKFVVFKSVQDLQVHDAAEHGAPLPFTFHSSRSVSVQHGRGRGRGRGRPTQSREYDYRDRNNENHFRHDSRERQKNDSLEWNVSEIETAIQDLQVQTNSSDQRLVDFPELLSSQAKPSDRTRGEPLPFPARAPAGEARVRNKQLLQEIMSFGGDTTLFKRVSSEYIKGQLSAKMYLDFFLGLFGSTDLAGSVPESLLLEVVALLPDDTKRMLLHIEYAKLLAQANVKANSSENGSSFKSNKSFNEQINQEEHKETSFPLYSNSRSYPSNSSLGSGYPSGTIDIGTIVGLVEYLQSQEIVSILPKAQRNALGFLWSLACDAVVQLQDKFLSGTKLYVSLPKVSKVRGFVQSLEQQKQLSNIFLLGNIGLSNKSSELLRNLSKTVAHGSYDELKDWAWEILSTLASDELYLISLFVVSLTRTLAVVQKRSVSVEEVCVAREHLSLEEEFGFFKKQGKSKGKKKR